MKKTAGLLYFLCIFTVSTFSVSPNAPFLGVQFSETSNENYNGIKIDNIIAESAASKSKLKKNDIIILIDTQKFPSKNSQQFFKNYITKEKSIGDELMLHVLRENLSVSRKIKNQYIDVDFNSDQIINIINKLDYGKKESFNFQKSLNQELITIILEKQPKTRTTTPNITLSLESKINHTAPYYKEFFKKIAKNYNFEKTLSTLKNNQLSNEFWDDTLRLSTIRYLHVNYFNLPSYTKVIKQELINLTPEKSTRLASKFLDLTKQDARSTKLDFPQTIEFDAHLTYIEKNIALAQDYLNKALKDLTKKEKEFIKNNIQLLTKALNKSFIISDENIISQTKINKILSIGKKINYELLAAGNQHLICLSNSDWIDFLEESIKKSKFKLITEEGISGKILFKKTLPEGTLIIGSKENNIYSKNIAFIIDIGGDDLYKTTAHAKNTNINMLIDLNGNDLYTSTEIFSQAASLLGYSLILDAKGNDSYRSKSLSQACAIMGIAQLIDLEGDDSYISQDYSQGIGFFGMGLLFDGSGNDTYWSGYFSQAVGMTKGTGFLIDLKGNDTYFLSNKLKNTYNSLGIFKGAGQGLGFGIRNFSSGGIGLLFDNKGNDNYESGNFSLGTGYFYGLGMFFDNTGHDTYKGARYSIATAAHSAIGLFSDSAGNDTYSSNFGSSIAIAWDFSNAYFVDALGDDLYSCENKPFTLAEADHNSFAFFNDKKGNDRYINKNSKPNASNSYNDGKSLAIFLDENGKNDFYLNNFKNKTITKLNDSFIFLDLETSLPKFIKSKSKN